VLVTLGGSDPENNTLKVIKALREVDVLNLEAIVIIGASNPHAEVLEVAARKSRLSIHLTCNAQNMPGLMAQADMAVAVSGISAWELAFMGLPSLVLRWADNQRSIAKELNAAGVALDLGLCSTLTTEGIRLELVKLAQSADARAEMSQRGQQLIDGNGGQRVVATMIAGVAA
jgi:spore coat polysaccharide biosynthesis predicted glycosyltransferase SpsG